MVATLGVLDDLRIAFSQVNWFIPHSETIYSPLSRREEGAGAVFRVVAIRPKSVAGYQAFPQVRVFTPHTGRFYSPSLATTLVAIFWLTTGYHPRSRL